MPELPEVEVVRAGLAPAVTGATVAGASVIDPRSLKRHVPISGDDGEGGHGATLTPAAAAIRAADFERRIVGVRFGEPRRRGKFMWIPIAADARPTVGCDPAGVARHPDDVPQPDTVPRPDTVRPLDDVLLAHLGMSGQLLLRTHEAPEDRHVTIRLWIEHPEHGALRLDFADQRRFGSLSIDRLVVDPDELAASETSAEGSLWERGVPEQARHIARDPLDHAFDDVRFVAALQRRRTAVKSALLDQTLMSGVGNIYADEALWRARLHPETVAERLSVRKAAELLRHVREVFAQALAEGGTSFDAQYVNVNGQAGYFAHSLNVYGRAGLACPRCGTPVRRIPFAGRSSHFCPRCQRRR